MAVDSNRELRSACARAVNRARKAETGTILYTNNMLLAAAQFFADDMAAKGYFDHKDKAGLWPWDRIKLAGYAWGEAGEDIAWGQTSGEQVVEDWKNSPGHWAQIIHPSYTEFGVGCAMGPGGRLFWVLDLARPALATSRALHVPITRRGDIVTNGLTGGRLSWCAAAEG